MLLANLILQTIVLISLLCIFFYWRFYSRKVRGQEHRYLLQVDFVKKELQRHTNSLDNLITMLVGMHQYTMTLAHMSRWDELYMTILNNACRLMNTDEGSLMLIDEDTKELRIVSSLGLPTEIVEKTRLRIGEGIAGRVAQTGQPIFVENIEEDQRFVKVGNNRHTSKSFICVPLKTKTRTLGVINISAKGTNKQYYEQDQRFLTMFADQSAITLENIELYENLQKFYWEMIQTLARAIDAKDSYTREHADRSVRYARAMSKEMNLSEVMTKNLEYAALMHDIGKIGIEEQILHKPTRLTYEENEIIKQHPRIGNRIIAPVPFLADVAPMILYHHEWYNGQGYLEGLAGEEIPLGARIIAIIDAYDAMTSDRPYRKALEKAQAIAELRKGGGMQFDPTVVESFIHVLEKEE